MKKGVFSYTMNSLIGRKLTIQNSSEKPNLQQKCDSHVQRVQAKADQYGQRVSSNQREENDSPKCQNPRFGAPAKKRTARKRFRFVTDIYMILFIGRTKVLFLTRPR